MKQLTFPKDAPMDAAFIMQGDELSPWIRDGQTVPLRCCFPRPGQCGVFQWAGRTLVRQYCEDGLGQVYLLVADRSRAEEDVICRADEVTCLGTLVLSGREHPLPLI